MVEVIAMIDWTIFTFIPTYSQYRMTTTSSLLLPRQRGMQRPKFQVWLFDSIHILLFPAIVSLVPFPFFPFLSVNMTATYEIV